MAFCDEVEEVEEEQGVLEVHAGAYGGVVQGDNVRAFIPTTPLYSRSRGLAFA